MLAAHARPAEHGSRTLTLTPTPDEAGPSAPPGGTGAGEREHTTSPPPPSSTVGVLRLRGGPVRRQRVVWSEGTIDNEGMGKKKSKICCIYHKPRKFDESSSESDSCDSDDDHDHGHDHSHGAHDHGHGRVGSGPSAGGQRVRTGAPGSQTVERSQESESEAESESESDGGAGDGRARPVKPRRKGRHPTKANKYDVQPTPKGKDKA